jgi:hypothetical protein
VNFSHIIKFEILGCDKTLEIRTDQKRNLESFVESLGERIR